MKKIVRFTAMLLAFASLNACGLMELEEQTDFPVTEMSLERDTFYLMVGDQFTLTPQFVPDTVTIDDVFWMSSANDVLSVQDNVFTGQTPGWVTLKAISVSHQLEDSCQVLVLRRWENNSYEYPYEMMVYANVTVHGQPFDPETMLLAAYAEGQLRGVGRLRESNGIQYVSFRVGSELSGFDPDPEGYNEKVTFRVYYKNRLLMEEFPQTLYFDGEAHGSLTNLYTLAL